ncbi:type II toxin-antitoxin system HicA family toxin [Clostridium perfringens]
MSKAKKKKKLKASEVLYNSMNQLTKAYAREIKILIQKYSSTSIVNKSKFGLKDIDLKSYNYLREFNLDKEIRNIQDKKVSDCTVGIVEVICRVMAHLVLISKVKYEERVKYIKDISIWEYNNIVNGVRDFLKVNNNYIHLSEISELKDTAESAIYYEYMREIEKEVESMVVDFHNEVVELVTDTVSSTVQELSVKPDVNTNLLADYSCEYFKETFKSKKIMFKATFAVVKMFNEELLYFYDSEIEQLDNVWKQVFDNCIEDIVNEKNNSTGVFISKTWRELESMALKAGFVYARSHGDHGIYYDENGKILIIPRGRTIGKGLQIQILKQIEEMD